MRTKEIKEEDLQGFKYLSLLMELLKGLHGISDHRNRELHYDEYITLILLYFFNPVLTSLRGIQQASMLEKTQQLLKVKATSLGSLSEASQVFDAEHLVPIIQELARQARPLETDPRLKDIEQAIIAVDGTLLRALPKMLWALWVNDQNRAGKLHLAFNIQNGMPDGAVITHGSANEKAVLRNDFLGPDKLFVMDAGYAEYKLLNEISTQKSSFVIRLRDDTVWELEEERALSQEDRDAGIQRDMIVRLGSKQKKGDYAKPIRIIQIFHKGDSNRNGKSDAYGKKTSHTRKTQSDYTFILATDRMDLSAEVIALLYKYRWQIELFFRWFKCILGCKHLLAQSHNGVSIQVYCALIASMLITLWTGRKPTKRTFEMLAFFFMGWASNEELLSHIEKLGEPKTKKS